MKKETSETKLSGITMPLLKASRRDLLAGAATLVAAAAVPSALANSSPSNSAEAKPPMLEVAESGILPTSHPIRTYMSASTLLLDGRIMITGGYSHLGKDKAPNALCSACILDANSGIVTEVSSMLSPRARHALVTLNDGRVAAVGGFNHGPLGSVEVYDPRTNRWEQVDGLSRPRYDHSVVTDGRNIVVIGGCALNMVSAVEILAIAPRSSSQTPL